jgi:DNA-binding transcriptional ArsR family regulator
MRIEANIAPVAALFAEPSRAAIMSVLLDGRALPAGELANLAGVSPTAASAHLTKLTDADFWRWKSRDGIGITDWRTPALHR